MNSEPLVSDGITHEDFLDNILKAVSVCDDNTIYPNSLNKNNPNNTLSTNEQGTENKITDTIILPSEINKSCSSSTLPNDNNSNENVESDANKITAFDKSLDMSNSQDIKAAIKVKWMDRSVFIQKTIQQHSQESWGEYISNLDVEKCLLFKTSIKDDDLDQVDQTQHFGKELRIVMNSASKSKYILSNEEVEYTVKKIQIITLIPKSVDIKQGISLSLYKPKVLASTLIKMTNIQPEAYNANLNNNDIEEYFINDQEMSIDESITKIAPPPEPVTNKEIDEQDKEMIMKLKMEIDMKNERLQRMEYEFKDVLIVNETLKNNLSKNQEAVAYLHKEMCQIKNWYKQIEVENITLKRLNAELCEHKRNLESALSIEKNNRKSLISKLESYYSMETDYQWLTKAFDDYQALCVDYDNVNIKCVDMENKLFEANNSIETLKVQMKYLESTAEFYKKQTEDIQTNQNHCLDNQCLYSASRRDHCSHHQSRRSPRRHSSSKGRRRGRRSVDSAYEHENYNMYIPEKDVDMRSNFDRVSSADVKKEFNEKELEGRYDELQLKKRILESELCHVPINNTINRRGSRSTIRGEKEQIENELDEIDQELSSLRRTLKQLKLTNLGNGM